MENKESNILKKFTPAQLLNFALGFFGLQFAWQLRVILSGPVTEPLGATPIIFGLIWLAGPITGMIVQPIVGKLSDKTYTRFGRRRPYLLGGAILSSIALWLLPNSSGVAHFVGNLFGQTSLPLWAGLLVASIFVWIIDASINISQGPYRALIPDTMPPEQYSIANAFISLAIGLGSVVSAGVAPLLKWVFNYQMSIESQFIMGALAFSLSMLWTCLTIKEHQFKRSHLDVVEGREEPPCFLTSLIDFFELSPEVFKICMMQFFTWVGAMCMIIFFTQYSIHTVYNVPDLTSATVSVKKTYENLTVLGTNFSSMCFTIFNLVCFLVAIPIGLLSFKYGNRKIHLISLLSMALAFVGLAFTRNPKAILFLMAVAGIGWASILALPFAMLSQYIKKGTEGVVMGIFNIFIAGPQVIVCTLVAWFISKCSLEFSCGVNYHWEYTFVIGAICLFIAAFATYRIEEKDFNDKQEKK